MVNHAETKSSTSNETESYFIVESANLQRRIC